MTIPKFPPSAEMTLLMEESKPPPTDCAWCLEQSGQALGEGSHGICEAHAEQIYAEHKAKKAA